MLGIDDYWNSGCSPGGTGDQRDDYPWRGDDGIELTAEPDVLVLGERTFLADRRAAVITLPFPRS